MTKYDRYGMIDLKELVIKAAKRGVRLYINFEFRQVGYGGATMVLRGERGECRSMIEVGASEMAHYGRKQDEVMNGLLDKIIRRMDDLEEELIEKGGGE